MKISLITMLLGLFCISADTSNGWKLAWSDEFNIPGAPDAQKWGYEQGFIRNHESQYYTADRRENARVEDGCLVIECRKEKFANTAHEPLSKDWMKKDEFASYTSAALITQGKQTFQYGRIEVRAKIPDGKGVWPAIWLLGDDVNQVGWPKCGEIDIMEYVGHIKDTIHGTLHFPNTQGKHDSKGGKYKTTQPSADFHIYAVEWSADKIDFSVDDNVYKSVQLDDIQKGANNPFRHPFYLLINFAIGGEWGGTIDDRILPQKFLIDYVRVYQKPQ